ncbi:MAG: hypothetical protein Tsb0014_07110 [Pleurocapsa sp.]
MSYLIFLGIGLATIVWGLNVKEEVAQLTAAIIGTIFLVWGLFLTPQTFLLLMEIVAVIALFRLCIRCCECD